MRYQVIRKLCDGGFSEIFEVENPNSVLRETLILKVLSREMSVLPSVQTAFQREARTLRELIHPNVVRFRSCEYDQGRICLVMEKVEGEALDLWARKNDRRPDLVLSVFARILEAVDFLHRRPVPCLHLDLKPENILVVPKPTGDEPVLIDFGIARGLGTEGLKAFTPEFSAPEQQRGGQLGCFTDVYALGKILAELIGVVRADLDPELRRRLHGVVARATQKSRIRRYADSGEMLRDFRVARGSRGRATTGGKLLESLAGSPGRQLALAAAALVILLPLAVLSLWLVTTGAGDGEEVTVPPSPIGHFEDPETTSGATAGAERILEMFRSKMNLAANAASPSERDQYFEEAIDLALSPEADERARQFMRQQLADHNSAGLNELLRRFEESESSRKNSKTSLEKE